MKKNAKNNDENVQVSAIFGIFSSFVVLFSPNIFNKMQMFFYLFEIPIKKPIIITSDKKN